jgi:hypothetical protein
MTEFDLKNRGGAYAWKAKVKSYESVGSLDLFSLVSEVLSHIPEDECRVICERLAVGGIKGVVYPSLDEEERRSGDITTNEGGRTQLCKKTGLCVIQINTAIGLEQIKRCIAHEFAHVLFDHPRTNRPHAKAEDEAKLKAKEWGF